MKLEELPSLFGPRPAEATLRKRRPRGSVTGMWTRRDFLKVVGATGVGVGLATLGVLPPARRALATHAGDQGYKIRAECYNDYDRDCVEPCQPSPICASCCQDDSGHHKYGWHRNTGELYRLRPDECTNNAPPNPPDTPDGWKWERNSCCGCNSYMKWRCHDGRKCPDGDCHATVCKWVLDWTYGGPGCGCF